MFEGLEDEVLSKIYIDSIIYIIGVTIGLILIFKRYRSYLRYYLIFFLIITFSGFNIFIKPVQDFNIPIPRTVIYYLKIISSASLYDIYIFGAFLFVLFKYLKQKRNPFRKNDFLSLLYLRDIIIFIIGILGSILYQKYGGEVEWSVINRQLRGMLTGLVVLYSVQKVITDVTDESEMYKLLNTLSVLTLINIISEILSAMILRGITWERGGHSIFMIDSVNTYLLMIYGAILFVNSKWNNKLFKLTGLLIVILLILDFYKITYLQLGLTIAIFVFAAIVGFSVLPRRIALVFPLFIIGFSIFLMQLFAPNTTNTVALQTRAGQLDGVYEAFDKNPQNILIGIGPGGLFKKQTLTEDGGEIKAIEIENTKFANLQYAFQVPFFFQIKQAGIIGGILTIAFFIMQMRRGFKLIKIHWYLACIMFIIAITCLTSEGISYPDPQVAVYYGMAYLFLTFNIKIYLQKARPSVVAL